jgi:sec-independent protein translocase protein TatA
MGFIGVGPLELAVIAVIALLVLGPQRLPETARALGRGMRELRDSLSGENDEENEPDADEEPAADEQPAARSGY